MGWWAQGTDGSSLHSEATSLVWGDGPADVMDAALHSIFEEFKAGVGRLPTQEEVLAGVKFSFRVAVDMATEKS